jgi:uncharacterized small protein (DUF1192 family)
MNLSNHNTLTIGQGLRLQGDDLALWRLRLSAPAYALLAAEVARQNAQLTSKDDGYSVFRGGALTNFICNIYL